MENYFTFFLCARDWGPVGAGVFPFVEELLRPLPWPAGEFQAAAHLKGSAGRGPVLNTSYRRLRREVAPEELAQLLLRVGGGKSGAQQVFLNFEKVRYRFTPEYLRFLDPHAPERVEAPEEFKIFSLSVRLGLFRQRLSLAARSALGAGFERLFVEARGAYGFARPTAWPIASPFQFVRDNSPGEGRLIADFDYESEIEDVYTCNYLSESHLRRVTALEEVCRGDAALECRRLRDASGRARGMAVRLRDGSGGALSSARACLRPLLRTPEPPRQTFHLLLHNSQCGAAERDGLGRYFFVSRVDRLPDFTRVTLRPAHDAESNRRFYADLNRFFEDLRPGLLRGGRTAPELMAHYHGPLEADQIFQRVPRLSPGPAAGADGPHAELCLTGDVMPARLRLTFLTDTRGGGGPTARLREMVSGWLSALSRRPEEYGLAEVVEDFAPFTLRDRVHATMVVDAARLRQDGFNLLMLLLDEVNRQECVVPYLVCGDLR